MEYDSKYLFIVTSGVEEKYVPLAQALQALSYMDGWMGGIALALAPWLRTEKIWSSHLHALYGMRDPEEYYFLYLFILFSIL